MSLLSELPCPLALIYLHLIAVSATVSDHPQFDGFHIQYPGFWGFGVLGFWGFGVLGARTFALAIFALRNASSA